MVLCSQTSSGINHAFRFVAFCLLLAAAPPCSYAFYEWQGEHASAELRGLLSGSATVLRNPHNPLFYSKEKVSGLAGSGRLVLDANSTGNISFELHAVQAYVPASLQSAGRRLVSTAGVERSDLLEWSFASRQGRLFLDRINLQYASETLSLKIGRQPVNLATSFYFTPNDFFAPFAAQAFFRSYKPGVDSLRADVQLGDLSQLSLITVMGFQLHAGSDNGWSNNIDSARTSYLGRASTVLADFELAAVAGIVYGDRIFGADFQGELFDWLGLRGEGHMILPDAPLVSNSIELSVSLEHRWQNSLTIRVEQYYHGSGAASVGNYSTALSAVISRTSYLARHYSALGASYEFTPLLNGDLTFIHNWLDSSGLLAVYALYSLADESELAINANIPVGSKPVGAQLQSEFGSYPLAFNIELRSYF